MKFTQDYTLAMRKYKRFVFFHHCFNTKPPNLLFFIQSIFHSEAARNKQYLKALGFTHVLNAAEGTRLGQVDTGHSYYRDMPSVRWDDLMCFCLFMHIQSSFCDRVDPHNARGCPLTFTFFSHIKACLFLRNFHRVVATFLIFHINENIVKMQIRS